MVQWHLRSKRKPSGGRLRPYRKKRRMDRGRDFTATKVGERRIQVIRTRGGGRKIVALAENFANVKVGNEVKRVKIIKVVDNPANPQLARQSIITKGAIIDTELGLARVTSRPSQHGVVNAVLIETKETKAHGQSKSSSTELSSPTEK